MSLSYEANATFSRKFYRDPPPGTCHGSQIDIVSSYRCLGVELTEFLDYTHTATVLYESAGRALGALVAKYHNLNGLGYDSYTKIYQSTVVPVSDYASGVWGGKASVICNKVHFRDIRSYLGVGKFTPVAALMGETAWDTPTVRHKIAKIKLWLHLQFLPESRLTKRVFMWDMQQAKDNKHN